MDQQGRGVEGHIVRYDEHKNSIQFLAVSGKRVWVQPQDFSAEDQKYIQDWIDAKQFLSNTKLRTSIDKRTKNGVATYDLTFKNNSSRTIAQFVVEYKFHIEIEFFGAKDQERWKSGRLTVGSLAPGADRTYTITSGEGGSKYKTVSVATTTYYGGTTYSQERHKVSTTYTRGFLLRMQGPHLDGTPIIRELSEPTSLAKKYDWDISRD